MYTVRIHASESYDVRIGAGLLSDPAPELLPRLKGRSAMLVSDDCVFPLYGASFEQVLEGAGVRVCRFVFPHGERSKTLDTYGRLLESLSAARFTRADCVLAIGGGVTGDLAGFAAATYQRGIGLIQLPTSLLAAVDSSVGGKTAVDLPNGKNQVGTFYQPELVLCDTETFRTLPADEYRNGCAEIIKYAMLGGGTLFRELAETPVSARYEEVVRDCVEMKGRLVEQDERDQGSRRLLNFGHTVGHAVEACSGYSIPHGMAVAIGMAVVTRAAAGLGFCPPVTSERLTSLLTAYALPTQADFPAAELLSAAYADKKISGDTLSLVVPEKVGRCAVRDIPKNSFGEWLKAGGVR